MSRLAAGMGNKDLWDKAFHHDRILGFLVLLLMSGRTLYSRGPCCPFLPLDKGNEDSGNEIGLGVE